MAARYARLSDAELVERQKLVAKHGNASKAARVIGIGSSAFRESIREAKRRGLTATSKVVDVEARLRTKLQLAERELAAIRRANDTAESIRKEIHGLSAMVPSPPSWVVKRTKPGAPGVPMTIWSDWHWGERVARAEVGGVNEFNRKIGWQRVRTLVTKTIDLAYDHMVNPDYPGIVVCLGGDFLSGGIHAELAESADCTTQQAFIDVQEALIWALTQIADKFGRVFVPCVVGNHGRDTQKPRFKQAVFHSYEWNLYCQLEHYFRADKRFRFMVPDEPDCHFVVAGHRYFLTHGDNLGVNGGDGQLGALAPITRGSLKVGRQQKQIGRDFDTIIMGHYHCYTPRSEASCAIVNGCLIGFNEYANLKLRVPYSRPSQALWFSHPTYGITYQLPIYLEAQQRSIGGKKRPNDWVTWQNTERANRQMRRSPVPRAMRSQALPRKPSRRRAA